MNSWLAPFTRLLGALRRVPRAPQERLAERTAAERVLEHYRMLLVDLGAVVWEFDPTEGRVTAVSDSSAEVLGFTPRQLRESPGLWAAAQHPDDRERSRELVARLMGGARHDVYDHRMIAADGGVVWLHTAVRAGLDGEGRPMLSGVSMDITTHKRLGSELQGALSLLQATLDATDNGILVVGLDGRIASYNRKFTEIWGFSTEVMGTLRDEAALAQVAPQLKEPERFLERIHEIYRDPDASSFDVIEFSDGRVLERTSQSQRLGGETVGRVWSFRDVSERIRTERALQSSNEQLQQAQKMEAVGQLAGGVAHDFNNILTAVLGNLSLILADPEVPLGVRQRAEEIQLASERAANLTRQLLAFGRRQILTPRVEYLCVILVEMLKLLRISAGGRVTIELELMPEPCPVLLDRGQMEQVILNLVINARDAMPNGGRIVISTCRVEAGPDHPLSFTPNPAGSHVLLSVTDNGEGMDAATMARAFEPFFTTKSRGRGTGLGLATAYGMVQQSGGSIRVRSAPGAGATFEILLPYSTRLPGAGDAPAANPDSPGVATVLVVEDEPPLRGLMRDALAQAGYRVIEAPSGQDALEFEARLPGDIDALVSDIAMAGMDGIELASQLRARRQGMSLLFVTGFVPDDSGGVRPMPKEARVLRKPFGMEALVRQVRESLGTRPARAGEGAGAGAPPSEA